MTAYCTFGRSLSSYVHYILFAKFQIRWKRWVKLDGLVMGEWVVIIVLWGGHYQCYWQKRAILTDVVYDDYNQAKYIDWQMAKLQTKQ